MTNRSEIGMFPQPVYSCKHNMRLVPVTSFCVYAHGIVARSMSLQKINGANPLVYADPYQVEPVQHCNIVSHSMLYKVR